MRCMYFNVTISSATVALETIKHVKDIQRPKCGLREFARIAKN